MLAPGFEQSMKARGSVTYFPLNAAEAGLSRTEREQLSLASKAQGEAAERWQRFQVGEKFRGDEADRIEAAATFENLYMSRRLLLTNATTGIDETGAPPVEKPRTPPPAKEPPAPPVLE
ncbi:MAG: hypothetical protein AAGC92_07465 [Pseudomonadota bacterium]